MPYSLEAHGLSLGDQLISKSRKDWGILFPRSVVNDVVLGGWVDTNGIPSDRPDGLPLEDVAILSRNDATVEPYSDFN